MRSGLCWRIKDGLPEAWGEERVFLVHCAHEDLRDGLVGLVDQIDQFHEDIERNLERLRA